MGRVTHGSPGRRRSLIGERLPGSARARAAAAALCAAAVMGLQAAPAGVLVRPALAQPATQPPVKARAAAERPVPRAAIERASESGGWWMIVQTACDVERASAILDRLNAVLSSIASARALEAVAERVQDPYLPEPLRLKMEGEMRRVSELQTLAGGIRAVEGELAAALREMKPLPERLDRAEWKLAQPLRSEAELAALREATDRALDNACTDGIERLQVRFVDAKTGILPLLR